MSPADPPWSAGVAHSFRYNLRMLSKWVTGAFISIFLAGLAIGCGSSSSGEGVSKKQFAKQADAICEKANEKQEQLLESELRKLAGKGSLSNSEKEHIVNSAGIPPLEEEATKLDELPAPSGEEEKVEGIIAAIEDGTAQVEKEPAAFAEGESSAFAEAEKLASKFGMKVCGQP